MQIVSQKCIDGKQIMCLLFLQVVNESTGFLCEPKKDDFGRTMARFVIGDSNLSKNMGEKGRKRVQQHFSFEAFSEKLATIIEELLMTYKATDHSSKKQD